jgi:GGDEF domain-containing protein
MFDPADGLPAEVDTRDLLEHVPLGMLIQRGDTVEWVNQTLLSLIGISRSEFPSSVAEGSRHPQVAPLFESAERVFLTVHDSGQRCLQRVPVGPAHSAIMVLCFLDITRQVDLEQALEGLERKLSDLDTRDHETGLLNRRGILMALDRELSRSRRYGNPLALIRLTLEPPEDVGDATSTLQDFSHEFNTQLRWADEVGRLDQASFLLILPETGEDGARLLAAKLAQERLALAKHAEGWKITAVVAAWQKGDDQRKLLNRAGWETA